MFAHAEFQNRWTTALNVDHSYWSWGVNVPSDNSTVVAGLVGSTIDNRVGLVGRYNQDGSELWHAQFGTVYMTITDLAVDSSGNAYISGNDQNGAFVRSFNATTGAQRWAYQPAPTYSFANNIVVKKVGNSTFVYVVFEDKNHIQKGFLARLNPSTGAEMMRVEIPSLADPNLNDVTADSNGNPIVFGGAKGTGDMNEHGFVAKYSASGAPVWHFDYPNSSRTYCFTGGFQPVSNRVYAAVTSEDQSDLITLDGTSGAQISDVGLTQYDLPGEHGSVIPLADGRSIIATVMGVYFLTNQSGLTRVGGTSGPIGVDGATQVFAGGSSGQYFVTRLGAGGGGLAESGQHGLGATCDTLARAVSFGYDGAGHALIRQDIPDLAVNNDDYRDVLPGTLNVEAPGVLSNDGAYAGGTLILESPPTYGSLTLNQDGSFSYIANSSFPSPDTFSYRITKGAESKTATVKIYRVTLTGFTGPSQVVGGDYFTLQATVSTACNFRDLPIAIDDDQPGVTHMPSLVMLKGQATGALGFIHTVPVASSMVVNFTATLGVVTKHLAVTLVPGGLQSFAVSPSSFIGGAESTSAILTLTGTPPGNVGATFFMPGGMEATYGSQVGNVLTYQLSYHAVNATENYTVSAHMGSVIKSANISIRPTPVLTNLTLSRNEVVGGDSLAGTLTLDSPSIHTGFPATQVNVTDSSSAVTTPSTVSFGSGVTSQPFSITTTPLSTTVNVTIKATRNGVAKTAILSVKRNPLSTLQMTPLAYYGAKAGTGKVVFVDAALAGGADVSLSSSSVHFHVPASAHVNAGAMDVSFAANSDAVASSESVTVTATYLGKSVTRVVTLHP